MSKQIPRSQIMAMLLVTILFSAMIYTAESGCSEAVVASLASTGFKTFAQALRAHNMTTVTNPLTLVAPPDTSLHGRHLDSNGLRRHISAVGAFPYQSLLRLPTNTSLPTLRRNSTLLVGSYRGRVSVNGVLLSIPNLFYEGSCAVHGIESPLVPLQSLAKQFPKGASNVNKSLPLVIEKPRGSQISNFAKFVRRANHRRTVGGRDGTLP